MDDILVALDVHYMHHSGITLSGGDPFLQPYACKRIADHAHKLGINVWAYCGLTYEQIIEDPDKLELLKSCDVLVDGPYKEKLHSSTIAFRGSKNQRIIDVKASLKNNEVVL